MLKAVVTRREPLAVELLREALSERLGRPAASRPRKGARGYWLVSDPCFAVLQRDPAGGRRDYRTGVAIEPSGIWFESSFARGSARFLRQNLRQRPELLEASAAACRHLRLGYHRLSFASRRRAKETGGWSMDRVIRVIEADAWPPFRKQLREEAAGIAEDLFPNLPSAGLAGTGEALRGHMFVLRLADRGSLRPAAPLAQNEANARAIIAAAWHLFACLYPWEPARVRRADLRRALQSEVAVGPCEYNLIQGAPRSPCDDSDVQAAHIIPYARGGNDRPWNGIWLCAKHHRETEGQLTGRRDPANLGTVRVRFVG